MRLGASACPQDARTHRELVLAGGAGTGGAGRIRRATREADRGDRDADRRAQEARRVGADRELPPEVAAYSTWR